MSSRDEHERLLGEILSSIGFPERRGFLPFTVGYKWFDVVTEVDVLLEAFQLRFVAYSKINYIDPGDYPLRKEFDSYDDVSVHFVARDLGTKQILGYTRLIFDSCSRMQIDDILDISDYRVIQRNGLCEMSRLISYPAEQRGVGKGLRYAACKWAETCGIPKIVGVSLELDREAFDRRRFVPMEPYRRRRYQGKHFKPMVSKWLYGNVFDVNVNKDYIASLR